MAQSILSRRHPHLLQEGHAHLLGVGESRQPADVLDWQVGPLQEMPGAAASAVVDLGEQAVPAGRPEAPFDGAPGGSHRLAQLLG